MDLRYHIAACCSTTGCSLWSFFLCPRPVLFLRACDNPVSSIDPVPHHRPRFPSNGTKNLLSPIDPSRNSTQRQNDPVLHHHPLALYHLDGGSKRHGPQCLWMNRLVRNAVLNQVVKERLAG